MTALPQMPPIRMLRCSALDGLFACTPSVLSDDPSLVRVKATHEASEIGHAIHQLAADLVDGKDIDIPKVCDFHQVDQEDVSTLYGYVERTWAELKIYFESPQTEVIVASGVLNAAGKQFQVSGTGDIISPIGTQDAIFLDWKSGFLDDGYHQQMAGYAYCTWCEMGKPEQCTITGVVAFLRHRYYRIVKYDATLLKAWEYNLTHNILPNMGTYRPGKTCRRCDLYAACPARTAMVGATLQTVMYPGAADPKDPNTQEMLAARRMLANVTTLNRTDPELGQTLDTLLVKIKLAEQQIEEARGLIRSAVQRVGYVPMPGGMALALRTIKLRKIDPSRAIRVLRTMLSEQQIINAMTLSLPKLLAARRGSAVKGEKTSAASALEEALEQQGAINEVFQERLEEIDLSQAIEEEEAKNGQSRSTNP